MYKSLIFILLIVVLSGCSLDSSKQFESTKKNLPDVFGAELNNLSYMEFANQNGFYQIDFMSVIDVTEFQRIEIEFEKGSFDYTVELSLSECAIEDYNKYILEIMAENLIFEENVIEVEKICIYLDDKSDVIELIPQKFTIGVINEEWEHDSWSYTNTPFSYPIEYDSFHFGMEVEKNIEINKAIISNDSFVFVNESEFINAKWGVLDSSFDIEFRIKETELSKYTQYVTDVVIWYDVDGETYSKTAMAPITYNPFTGYDDLFEMYYNEVILNQ